MSKVIPNENTWIGFSETQPAVLDKPTSVELTAAQDMTCFVVTINASAQGNTVPTPVLCSLFETSVPGTSQATFQADFYRDDDDDAAWEALKRGVEGVFYISRFGGSGANKQPASGESLEVWPVIITSRAAGALSSNTAQTFSVTAAVNVEPAEDAVVT